MSEHSIQPEGGSSPRPKAMLLSVGGSPAPVIASLNAQQPEYVCFFVSAASRAAIESEILPALAYRPRHHDWIETPSAEDLLVCYGVLRDELPRLAEKWQVPLSEWTADYTGGTKTMSVAVGLATIQAVARYSYVGGSERTKDGLGVVVDGKERILRLANPWDVLAVAARQRASLLFSRGRYEAAAEEYEAVAGEVSSSARGVYQALALLCRGYADWDRFAHASAQESMRNALKVIEPYAAGLDDPAWTALVNTATEHENLLIGMRNKEGGGLRVGDLIANARRRGELEARYDDAVARLYSALEMAARFALASRHGIRTSRALPAQVPETLREEFCRSHGKTDEKGDLYLKLPHYAAYRLLAELKDDLAARYFAREKTVKAVLDQRNSSVLAHGDRPVGEKVYRQLFPLVSEIIGVDEEGLPEFPQLPA
jgi:CRISPR-associated protein (TIGR02710 family)